MEWLLVICLMIMFGIGWIVVKKIDDFLAKPYVFAESKHTVDADKPYILLFGDSQVADKLILLFKNHNIDYVQIEDENQLDRAKYYSHLFAISKSDMENLLINAIVNRMNGACKKISICNSSCNQNIYKQSNIRYLYDENMKAEALFNIMFPSTDNFSAIDQI